MSLKKIGFAFFFFGFVLGVVFAQHNVDDIKKHDSWYKVRVEVFQSGNTTYHITQCYPSGKEYEITGIEKEKLPLYLKVLCIGMAEEGMKDSFDFNEMIFEDDGRFIQLTAISFTLLFKFSKTEAEILKEIGDETVNKYRYRTW